MNIACHKSVACEALNRIDSFINVDIKAMSKEYDDVAAYFDMTLEQVRDIEPDYEELLFCLDKGSVQIRSMEFFNSSTYAILTESSKRIDTYLQNNNISMAIKSMLLISHLFADSCGTPVHVISTEILDVLYERPERLRSATIHALLESVEVDIDMSDYSPFLSHMDRSDIVLHAIEKEKVMKEKTGYILPKLVKAYYDDDNAAIIQHTGDAMRNSSEVFCDFCAQLFLKNGYWIEHIDRDARKEAVDLRENTPFYSVLDMCCNYKPMIDHAVLYHHPPGTSDLLGFSGEACKGIGVIPLSANATEFPRSEMIPFEYGKCYALLGYYINSERTYNLKMRVGHNSPTFQGGRVKIVVFSEKEVLFDSGVIDSDDPVLVDIAIKAEKLYFFAEDLDAAWPPLKYITFENPILQPLDTFL